MTSSPVTDGFLYRRLCQRPRLRRAWGVVRANAQTSSSAEIRDEVEEFEHDSVARLERIREGLRKGTFRFSPGRGIKLTRPGKKKWRPVVVPPIDARIVQRAILDVLSGIPAFKKRLSNRGSFGGVPDRSVRKAIEAVLAASAAGATHFVRSDIKDFFTSIPRADLLDSLAEDLPDEGFLSLLRDATRTELENHVALGTDVERFPIHDDGVAQGSCLSPMLGNLLLYDFDREFNARKLICIRYIDDFLILGKGERRVHAAFDKALAHLSGLRLSAYTLSEPATKAEFGEIRNGFDFLGCNVRPDRVRPGSDSCARVKERVSFILERSLAAMANPEELPKAKLGLAPTLRRASNVLEGWGNQYSFCNDRRLLASLDAEIDEILRNYLGRYRAVRDKNGDRTDRRRLLGVHSLVDSNSAPLIPKVV